MANLYRYGQEAIQSVEISGDSSYNLENSGDTIIDPATEQTVNAIAQALGTEATDVLRVTAPSALSTTVSTWNAGTLPTEQQTPVGVEDSGGIQIDPATETTLANIAAALASNATDSVLVDSNTALDASAATVTTNATVQNNATGAANGTAVSGNGAVTVLAGAEPGAERIVGQVVSSGSYDVIIDWKDSAGNVIRSETINSGLTGGTWYNVNEVAKSAYADLKVVDTSGVSQTVDGTGHMR